MQPFVINRRTEFKYVRLIDHNEEFHDKVFIGDAKEVAKQIGLDLVCFSLNETGKHPLCKIIDYGKWKYHEDKKKKKNQSHTCVLKEVRFSPVISDHDIEHKMKQVYEFLQEGDEVLLTMRFKGIQKRNFKQGSDRMDEIIEESKEVGEVVSKKQSGNQIIVRLKKASIKK